MVHTAPFHRPRSLLLALIFIAGPAVAFAQTASAPPTTTAAPTSPPESSSQELLDRLARMEERLNWLTKEQGLLRENRPSDQDTWCSFSPFDDPRSDSAASTRWVDGNNALIPPGGVSSVSQANSLGQSASASADSGPNRGLTAGGGSKASGGDPTAIGRAQEVGNLHLGETRLDTYYDFDEGGFHFTTADREFGFAFSGMTQLDGMLYSRPTPGLGTSSGFYNPRSRIYFEGNVTQPITWEFSFQNFYDTVQLLDAYVNFNYDPRLQLEIGRYKNPFGYEFYRIHVWDLMAPERSLWANNFEANRRFGIMAHGILLDERVEYAAGSFDGQRNSFRPFDSLQDFEGFVNFKPFYTAPEDFPLRNLQFGGSVDLGDENQNPVPDTLRTNRSPGADPAVSTAASSAASLAFLSFNPTVLESGFRELWEVHLAYYYAGLSAVSAVEGGHESYAASSAAPNVHVPIHGWFVQGGYLLTGETIRDRTLIQPLRPFDMRGGRFGLGAWEVTARFSQLDVGSEVFSAGLANPNLWTNHAKLIDVGANWYLNQFVKVYFDWEHALFGSPVVTSSGDFRSSNDLFWVRTQIYF
jgi:phosphate-selective porin OprO/OprP